MPDTQTAEQWQRRALRAEAAVRHALWLRPMTYRNETATELTTRFRLHVEARYPDLIIRFEHHPMEAFKYAEDCGCDPTSDGYDGDHSEEGEDGYLCERSPLGRICDSCKDEDGDGPDWRPDGVLWPCPPIREVNVTPSDARVLATAMTPAAAVSVEG